MERRFWAVGDKERLSAETSDDAFDEFVEDMTGLDLPETATAHEFGPMVVAAPDHLWVLEGVLDQLDEKYGDQDGDSSEATGGMIAAAKSFCETIQKEYVSWNCEKTGGTRTVNVADWMRGRNAPETDK